MRPFLLLRRLRDWCRRQRIPCECGECGRSYWPWQIEKRATHNPYHPHEYLAKDCFKRLKETE